MSTNTKNTGFQCEHCRAEVLALTNGSYRNHCPFCLYSKHLDNKPGDRSSTCQGLMKPVDIIYHSKKGYQIVHECISCHKQQRNIVAVDTEQPDNILQLFEN